MEIVEAPAYLPRRAIVCRDPPSQKRRHLFGQQALLDILSRTELLLDATALLHTRVLLRKRPLLRYAFDQLLRHRIELLLQLPNFVAPADPHSLCVVAVDESCRGLHQAMHPLYQASRRQHTKEHSHRRNDEQPGQSTEDPSAFKHLENDLIRRCRHLHINGPDHALLPAQDRLSGQGDAGSRDHRYYAPIFPRHGIAHKLQLLLIMKPTIDRYRGRVTCRVRTGEHPPVWCNEQRKPEHLFWSR